MKKPVIAVDIDEVLAHHNVELVKYHNEAYGSNHTIEQYISDHWSEIWGVEKDEASRRAVAFHETGVHSRLAPINEAQDCLTQLAEHFDLHIVTARRRLIVDSTHEWVEKHYPGIFKGIRFVHVWEDLDPPSKAEVCKEIGAVLLIDDSVSHCSIAAKSGIDALLFGDYAWNRTLPEDFPDSVQRVTNWQGVIEFVRDRYDIKF